MSKKPVRKPAVKPRGPNVTLPNLSGKVVWFAEDNRDFREEETIKLREAGAEVVEFESALDIAGRLFNTKPGNPVPDVIVADWTFSPTPRSTSLLARSEEPDVPNAGSAITTIMSESKNQEVRRIPVIFVSGALELRNRIFSGLNVQVVSKISHEGKHLASTIKRAISGRGMTP